MPTPVKSKYVAAVVHVACGVIGGCHFLAPGVLKINAEWRCGSNPCSRAGVKNTDCSHSRSAVNGCQAQPVTF